MKKILFLISSLSVILGLGGAVYADDSTSSIVSNVSDTVFTSITHTSEITSNTSKTSSTTTKKAEIGQSSFNIVVSDDDMFVGLETFLNAYTTEVYAPQMTPETRSNLTKILTSLIISVVTGNSSYTLETFKETFIQILVEHGINVTEDVIDAITKYAVHYLEDDLEEDETDDYLVFIGGTVGMMTTLFITSQMGGVHRA